MKLVIIWLKAALITILMITPVLMYAQGPGFDEDVADTPIDGGVTLIAAAAAGYGIKKMRDKRKK